MQNLRIYILTILISLFGIVCDAQVKIYKLKSKIVNADFDYSVLNDLDPARLEKHNLKPVKGKFTVYKFLFTFKASSDPNVKLQDYQDFNDILIIKTDNHNKIIDAYQYTLKWSDPPFYILYKSGSKNKILIDKLAINQLKLTREGIGGAKGELLKDNGIISLSIK
jgi:hypothetical protein